MGVSDGVCLEHYKFPGKDAANFWIFAIPCFQTPKKRIFDHHGVIDHKTTERGITHLWPTAIKDEQTTVIWVWV